MTKKKVKIALAFIWFPALGFFIPQLGTKMLTPKAEEITLIYFIQEIKRGVWFYMLIFSR